MKTRITNYTFDASAQTITFSDYASISLDAVLLITNVTDNIIIYNFSDATKGGTVLTNVLTLTYDTTTMSDTDDLLIYYDDALIQIPPLGQALAADSLPVILPSATITTLTPPAAITNFANESGGNLETLASIDFATQTTLALIKAKTDNIPALGQALAAASVPVVLTAAQLSTLTPPAAITGFALETGGNLATIAGKDFATQTTLAALNAKLVSGTDIGDVTVNNAAGSGVYVQPGTSTVWDVSDRAARLLGVVYGSQGQQLQQKVTSNDLIVTLDGESVAVTGTFWQATQPVSLVSVPSHDVTNAGTFAVQESGAALTALQLIDNAVSGTGFNISQLGGAVVPIGAGLEATAIRVTLPTNGTGIVGLATGSNAIGKLVANSGVDIGDVDVTSLTCAAANAKVDIGLINGVTPLMGNGVSGTGAMRVTIASDSTGTVIATQGTATNLKTQAENYQGGTAVGAANPLQVSLANNGANATAVKVNVASGGIAAGSIATGAIVDALADDSAFTVATSRVFPTGLMADETSTDSVDEGDVGVARMTLDRKAITTVQPHTAGGLSVANFTSGDTYTALTNSAQAIKASAGQIYGWYIFNPNTTTIYVLVYNIAAASVTVGTSTATLVLAIPAGAAANVEFTNGIAFSTAMSCAAATTGGGNTAPTTAMEVMFFYK